MRRIMSSIQVTVIILITAILLASCGSAAISTKPAPAPDPVTITYVTTIGNAATTELIKQLAESYRLTHPHVSFQYEEIGNADLSYKIQLLAASNDLPVMFSYPSGKPLIDLIDSGAVLNLGKSFDELDLSDQLLPTAVDLLESHVDDRGLYAIPLEMNLEGFWYNKDIFKKYEIEVPETWNDMLEASEVLIAHGIQPFAVAGKEKWPITRFINAYLIRKNGVNAMKLVDHGAARLTDDQYIEAAQMVRNMAFKGYFGQASRTDFAKSKQLFLQGEAAIFYSGSWSLRDFNNSTQLPESSIGFFSIPLVEGGVGTLDEYPVNAGLTTSFSREAYNEEIADWIKHIFNHYGQAAMDRRGMITGFKVDHMPNHIPPLTRMVQNQLSDIKSGALWFEARFTTEEQLAAWDHSLLLITDPDYTAERYMSELHSMIDKNRQGRK